jgi:nucleotide-binding universal stress UspA family protein
MNVLPRIEEQSEQKVPPKKEAMLARIMVATDFSPVSDRALDYAVSLARRFGSQIYLTHVIPFPGHSMMEPGLAVPTAEDLRAGAKRQMQDIVDSGALYGVPYEVILDEGLLWPALEMLLEKKKINLLVLGTHGMSGAMKAVFGSAAEAIFRQARVPVLTVGPAITKQAPFEAEFQNILFATAFGPGAEREAAIAFKLAQEHRSKLTLLHVTERPDGFTSFNAEAEREAIRRQMRELVPACCEPACKLEFHVTYGSDPVREILRAAHETKADLIVIGAKKRGALAGHVVHSKAFRVVRDAGCPVLTVKS